MDKNNRDYAHMMDNLDTFFPSRDDIQEERMERREMRRADRSKGHRRQGNNKGNKFDRED